MNYWDKTWSERINGDGPISMNQGKARFICTKLWERPHYLPLMKLEIGCGPMFHAQELSQFYPDLKNTWYGMDTSTVALDRASSEGFHVIRKSIYDFETDKKFSVFLFLDVLEHLDNHELVSQKVKKFATERFYVFGNIPLYQSEHEECGGYERPMSIKEIKNFVEMCNCIGFWARVYGINYWPYMVFEAWNFNE